MSEMEKATLNLASALDQRFKSLLFLPEEEKQETLSRLIAETLVTLAHHDQGEVERLDQEDLGNCGLNEETDKNAEGCEEPPTSKRRGSCALAELLGNTFGDVGQALDLVPQEKSAFNRAEEEVKDYNTAASLPLSENPFAWWKDHHHQYPLLAKFAKQYLCVTSVSQVTSVSAERVFSTAGDIVTAQQSTLTAEHVDQHLFLHKNVETTKH
ncbi:zinc finger BED domain-containing protein 1-like [Myripristis murdjan]|uniref:zinc finger BED domain-containing protein 1-like n=1 Tax=Myripristis murdjan TaxID=586833 RepID=UPI0011762841|nr:zinc finger BED domain-containing protein 1-like [Myripristis murdjan]